MALALAVGWGACAPASVLGAAPSSSPAAVATSPSPPSAPLLRIPFPQEDGSLTPYTFELGYPLVTLVYDTLMWRDRDGVPQPWLARSVEPSADGSRLVIRLNTGARWQDGPPVTASDVAFTFRYAASHPHPRFTPEVAIVERVDTPDPATAVISLRQPSPGFADQTLADLPIIPSHIWQTLRPGQPAPDGPPIGSGPYRLTAHVPGQSYRFDANPAYFLGPPRVSTIVMPIIGDVEKTLTAFEQHSVDMVPVSLPENEAARLNALGDRVVEGLDYVGAVLMLNTRRPPFDRPDVRQAVSRAMDPARFAQVLGNAVAANRGYVHPESPWAASKDLHHLDTESASRVLAPLNLPPVDVLAPDNDGVKMEAAHQAVVALHQAGVNAQAKPVSRSFLSRAVGEDGSAPSFTMAVWGAYPLASYDPDFLSRAFGSGPGALFNYPGYRSSHFDSLAARVATTVDPRARHALVDEELTVLADDAPVIPLYYPVGSFAIRPSVYDGWVYIKGTGILDKRSFAGPRPAPPVAAQAGSGRAHPPTSDTGGGLPALPLAIAALAFIVAAIIGGVVELIRRRT